MFKSVIKVIISCNSECDLCVLADNKEVHHDVGGLPPLLSSFQRENMLKVSLDKVSSRG